MYVMTVSANGVEDVTATTQSVTGDVHLAGDVLYSDSGDVYDLLAKTTSNKIRPFSVQTGNPYVFCVVPNVNQGKLFLIGTDGESSSGYSLGVIGLIDRQLVRKIALPSYALPSYRSLIRWGDNGLAYSTVNRVVLISGDFVTK
jgi:hypothetical protein